MNETKWFTNPQKEVENYSKIQEAVDQFNEIGVESWQVNLSINEKGVKFLKHFQIGF